MKCMYVSVGCYVEHKYLAAAYLRNSRPCVCKLMLIQYILVSKCVI